MEIIVSALIGLLLYIAYILTATMRRVVDLHESKKLDDVLNRLSQIENKINFKSK